MQIEHFETVSLATNEVAKQARRNKKQQKATNIEVTICNITKHASKPAGTQQRTASEQELCTQTKLKETTTHCISTATLLLPLPQACSNA
jgi:hypothetical protein